MITHSEDAMTRERALEEALRITADILKRRANAGVWHNDRLVYDTIREVVEPALASAQQEPAPAAEVEEVTEEMARAGIDASPMIPFPDMAKYASRSGRVSLDTEQVTAIYKAMQAAAALRRYAGGGGVTWQPIETAPKEEPILLWISENESGWAAGPWRGSWSWADKCWAVHVPTRVNEKLLMLTGFTPTHWHPLSRLEPAARAKSGEKGT